VLWYTEAPGRARCGADAPGMGDPGQDGVKAAYTNSSPTTSQRQPGPAHDHLPAEDLRGHPAESAEERSSWRDESGCQRQTPVQPAPATRHEKPGRRLGRRPSRRRPLRQARSHRAVRHRQDADGGPIAVRIATSGHGKKLFEKKKLRRGPASRRVRGGAKLISVASAGAGSSTRPTRCSAGPGDRHGQVDQVDPKGLDGGPRLLRETQVSSSSHDRSETKNWTFSTLRTTFASARRSTQAVRAVLRFVVHRQRPQGCQASRSTRAPCTCRRRRTTAPTRSWRSTSPIGKEKWRSRHRAVSMVRSRSRAGKPPSLCRGLVHRGRPIVSPHDRLLARDDEAPQDAVGHAQIESSF